MKIRTAAVTSLSVATVYLIYKLVFIKKRDEEEEEILPREERNVYQYETALEVYETSNFYNVLYSKIMLLPKPFWKPLSLSSILRVTSISFRTFFLATIYTFTGILNTKRIVPSLMHSVFISEYQAKSILLNIPNIEYQSKVEMSSISNHQRSTYQLDIVRGQGKFEDCDVNGHKVCIFVKTTAKDGWDDYLRKNIMETSDKNDNKSLNCGGSSKSNGNVGINTSTPIPTRHMRKSSGLTWKCELCGERSEMSA